MGKNVCITDAPTSGVRPVEIKHPKQFLVASGQEESVVFVEVHALHDVLVSERLYHLAVPRVPDLGCWVVGAGLFR